MTGTAAAAARFGSNMYVLVEIDGNASEYCGSGADDAAAEEADEDEALDDGTNGNAFGRVVAAAAATPERKGVLAPSSVFAVRACVGRRGDNDDDDAEPTAALAPSV